MDIKNGYYKHYKGGIYNVIMMAKHTETEEEMVIYKDSDENLWCRPKKMFEENVEVEDVPTPRFKPLKVAVVVRGNDYECEVDDGLGITSFTRLDFNSDVYRAKYYNPEDKYEMAKLRLSVSDRNDKGENLFIKLIHMEKMYDGFNVNTQEQEEKLNTIIRGDDL